MDNRPIGIFDSGVGGLSILLEIEKLLPFETFIFVADQAFVPYGKKSKEELLDRVSRVIDFFVSKNVKAVVVACNTATVYTIEEMRAMFKVPIIGTVPVVKTLAELSKTRKAAVFSTPGTAKSPYLAELIKKHCSNLEIFKIGGSNLEELVEGGDLNSLEIQIVLNELLPPLVKKGVDTIALGCTHYPFLRDKIQAIVGRGVRLVDSGGAVSRRLSLVLNNNGILADRRGIDEFYTTGDEKKFHRVAETLIKRKIGKVHHLEI